MVGFPARGLDVHREHAMGIGGSRRAEVEKTSEWEILQGFRPGAVAVPAKSVC